MRVISMPRLNERSRSLDCSLKISTDIHDRLISLQGFLQLKERRKRSMDELIEFLLSFVPEHEINATTVFSTQSPPMKQSM